MNTKNTYNTAKFLPKTCMIMTLGLVVFLMGFEKAVSQNNTYLEDNTLLAQLLSDQDDSGEKLISIQFTNISLDKALEILAAEIKVGFSYSPEVMPDKEVSFSMAGVPPYEVLYKLLEGTNLEPVLPPSKDVIIIREKRVEQSLEIIQGTVRGTVQEAESGESVPGATVMIREIERGTSADNDGSFQMEDIPSGTYTMTVTAIGYSPYEEQITIESGSLQTFDIVLQTDRLGLEDVVVTGVATTVKRRNLANAVSSVGAEDLGNSPSQSIEQNLQGKIVGANIQSNSGAPGGGLQVTLRGVSSINADSQPLYVVDGIIISNEAISGGMGKITEQSGGDNDPAQDNSVNRVADLNPGDIESIEVLKGASASAIYGSKASNGVVIITTKRGRVGVPNISFSQNLGFFQMSNTIGSRVFETEAEAVSAFGQNAANYFEPGVTYNNEEELGGRRDISYETSLSVSGGTEETQYFVSGLIKDDKGIIANTGYEKQSLRVNLNQRLLDGLNLDISSNLIHSKTGRGLTNNDNTGTSFWMVMSKTPNFFDLRKEDGVYPENPFIGSNPIQTADMLNNDEDVWRFISSMRLTYNLFTRSNSSLRFISDFGVDRFHQKNEIFSPPELQYEPQDGLPGTLIKGNANNLNINSSANLVHTYEGSSRNFLATTSIGVQYQKRELELERVTSENLIAGQRKIDAATVVNVFQNQAKVVDFGLYLQEELQLFDERMLWTFGLRADQSSNAGDPNKFFYYPKTSISYRFLDIVPDVIDEIKLRTAVGFSGNQPLYGQKFTPLSANQNIEGNAGLTVAGVTGDPDIEPERQQEVEAGFDAILLDDRLTLEFTLYQQNITNLLLERELSPSQGFQTQFFNGGELQVQGIEIGVNMMPVNTTNMNWRIRSNFYSNRSKIVDLPVPGFTSGGFGASLGSFRIEEGRSATEIWANEGGEITPLGDANPDFNVTLLNDLSINRWNLFFLWEWQKGSDVINLTKLLYDLAQNSKDWNEAGQQRLSEFGFNTSPYVEDASFIKLREMSLKYNLNPELIQSLWSGFRYLNLGLTGRNLLTFTDYSGMDPEVSNFGHQQIGRNVDVAPYPPSRSIWFSVEVGL